MDRQDYIRIATAMFKYLHECGGVASLDEIAAGTGLTLEEMGALMSIPASKLSGSIRIDQRQESVDRGMMH